MKFPRIVAAVLCSSLLVFGISVASAQMMLQVNLDRAVFQWDYPSGGGATPDAFVVWCGAVSGAYTLQSNPIPFPTMSAPMTSVIADPGTYFCAVVAQNSFGVSDPSNEISFEAGYAPRAPSDFRLTVE
jgi:hypothetical protein